MSEPLISVVMPVYKAEATIARAVESVLGQTWTALELVLASDDGTDYRAYLANACGVDDGRIRQTYTGGVGTGDWSARNAGLAVAKGALATIIDSDDAYAPERLERLAPLALEDGAALDDTRLILNGETVASLLHDEDRASGAPVRATAPLILRDRVPVFPMWRRELADLTWRELPHASDVVFSLELLSAVPAMRVAPYAGYLYFKRPGSMTLSESMTERSRQAYLEMLRAIAAGDYALAADIRDFTLYELAKNLNQAGAFATALAADPSATHEMLAKRFNASAMTEAERVAFFRGNEE